MSATAAEPPPLSAGSEPDSDGLSCVGLPGVVRVEELGVISLAAGREAEGAGEPGNEYCVTGIPAWLEVT